MSDQICHRRMTVSEVEAALKASGWLREWDYARDVHFARFVLQSITTLDEAIAFAAELDQDNCEQTEPPFRWGCTKAKTFRVRLTKELWNKDSSSIQSAIAISRRVCCSCHETGSFCRIDKKPKRV